MCFKFFFLHCQLLQLFISENLQGFAITVHKQGKQNPSPPQQQETELDFDYETDDEDITMENQVFVHDMFNTLAKETTWFRNWKARDFEGERQFDLGTFPDQIHEHVEAVLDRRNWETLIQDPGEINVDLVREFFAILSLRPKSATTLKIRGVWVNFSPGVINQYYCIPHVDASLCDFQLNQTNDIYKKSVLDVLFPKATFVKAPKQVKATHLPWPYKFWHHFVNSRFLPTCNRSKLAEDRYTLIYKIQSEEDINAGEHIHSKIVEIAHNKRVLLMVFPCLITHLCRLKHVPEDEYQDTMGDPMQPLTYALILQVEKQKAAKSKASSSRSQEPIFVVDPLTPLLEAPPVAPQAPQLSVVFLITSGSRCSHRFGWLTRPRLLFSWIVWHT